MPIMPFVFVKTNKCGSEELYKNIKSACKNAWTSMGPLFKDTDVGGAIQTTYCLSPFARDKVFFIYSDRGVDFNNLLYQKLRESFDPILTFTGDIYMEPIKESEAWFPDPKWSQAPCTRLHRDEYDHFPRNESSSSTAERLREEKPDDEPSRQPFNT